MANMICLNEVSIKQRFYKTCVKNYGVEIMQKVKSVDRKKYETRTA